ncbi:hypothetical protein GCM10023223_50700 [Stackebrandtia albiflava]
MATLRGASVTVCHDPPAYPFVRATMAIPRFTRSALLTEPVLRSRRGRRLARRVVLPLAGALLATALLITGFARLGGAPADHRQPFRWEGAPVFIAGSTVPGTYTTCVIDPAVGERRRVAVPGDGGGIGLDTWFEGPATITCGRSVSVTTGALTGLYPVAGSPFLLWPLGFVVVAAWRLGRFPDRKMNVSRTLLWSGCGPRARVVAVPWKCRADDRSAVGPVVGTAVCGSPDQAVASWSAAARMSAAALLTWV